MIRPTLTYLWQALLLMAAAGFWWLDWHAVALVLAVIGGGGLLIRGLFPWLWSHPIRRPIQYRTKIILGTAAVLLLLAGYSFLSYRQHQKNPRDTTIPNAQQLVQGVQRVFDPDKGVKGVPFFWIDFKATFSRHFVGLVLGVLLSVSLGLMMGCYPWIEAFFSPLLAFLAKIPPTAMLAVFFVLVGTNFKLFLAMIGFGLLPTLALAVCQAAKSDVPEELIFKAYTLGGSHPELVWNVVFKQILPRVIESVRLQVGPALVYLVAAEWAVASEGFGHRLKMESRLAQMNVVYFYLVVLGGVGFLMDYSLLVLRKKLCPWFEG